METWAKKILVVIIIVTIIILPVQPILVQAAPPDQIVSPPDDTYLIDQIVADANTNSHEFTNELILAKVEFFGSDGLVAYYEEGIFSGKIAILKNVNNGWRIFTSYNPKFDQMLEQLPEELLSSENKKFFFINLDSQFLMDVVPFATYTGHKLPWQGGISHRVTQTPAEHSGLGDWAYDFSMNVGTPLWASHSGTVALVKENSSTGGCDPDFANLANYVVINNDGDNTATLYLHLNTNGVVVNVGQHVNQGDLIGYSGQTGYSCGAHLHFQVQDRGSWWMQSHRVVFDDPIGEPTKDEYVVSNNYRTPSTANCSNPTDTDVYVCNPTLTPVYNGNTCTSFWYRFTGYENQPAYVTLNAYESSTSSNSGVWTPNLPSTGTYEIFAHIGQHGSIDRNCGWTADTVSIDTNHAKYRVYSSGSTLIREVEINQYPYSNQWVSLGQFNLTAGTSAYVKLADVTGETRLTHNVSFGALHFELVSPTCYTLTTGVSPANAGTVSLSEYSSGSCPSGSYAPGTVVTATAYAGSGYQFSAWSGASTSSSKTVSIMMSGNNSITANFTSALYNTNWMPDDIFTGETETSVGQIRKFLEAEGSCLANEIIDSDGQTIDIPTLIHENSETYQINPKVLLTTMQKEQGAIATCPTITKLNLLMGITNVPTARAQIATSASLYRAYLDEQTATGSTRSGWAVGLAKETQDGVVVTPASKAIAGLFTYTPYAGEQWGGNLPGIGGTYLFKSIWDMYQFDQAFPEFVCHTLTLIKNPDAGGTINVLTDPSPDCGNSGYELNTSVQVNAVPASGFSFTNWTGDVNSPIASVTVVMDSDKQITANFQEESSSDTPKLAIDQNVIGFPGGKSTVGISFTGTADLISSASLSIDYDDACLAVSPADKNLDGVPDAVLFQVLPSFVTSATIDVTDTDGELDIVVSDMSLPFSTLTDGMLLEITFDVLCTPESGATITAPVNFSQNPSISFGNSSGQSVQGVAENGNITIFSGQPGDVNVDSQVDAGDISALVLEIFDGDGNLATNTLGGSFPGNPIGSDPNRDSLVDAGDISCLVLIIFNGQGACGSSDLVSTSKSPDLLSESIPQLALLDGILVGAGQEFAMPIAFTSNGTSISSIAFSIDYEQSVLFLDPLDSNVDGIPDAIQLDLPPGFTGDVSLDMNDDDGEIDIVIADLSAPLASLLDGEVVSLTFQVKPDASSYHSEIRFSVDPDPSFGDIHGQSVLGTTSNATVTINGPQLVFLPLIIR